MRSMLYQKNKKNIWHYFIADVKKVTWSVADFNMEMGYGEKGQSNFKTNRGRNFCI
jgi:hypothetical protein